MTDRAARLAFWRRPDQPPRPAPAARTVVLASLPVGLVATIAGIVSYSHIAALGLRTHQGADSYLLPFAVDFLIVAGSVILLAGYWLGWLCVFAGVIGTLFANLEFGLPYGRLAAMVSTWPAVSFTVATFVLERWLRSRRADEVSPTPGTLSARPPTDAESAALASLRTTLAAGNPWSQNQLMTQFKLTRAQAAKVRSLLMIETAGLDPLASMNGHTPPEPEPSE